MTSFAHVDHPTEHPGVVRAERVFSFFAAQIRGFDSARGAATLLLAAVVAAILVVANQVIETWTEGHLLAAWIVLWTVAFAALGLLAAPARGAVLRIRNGWVRSAAARRAARQDRALWAIARTDERVMAELSHAMTREGTRDVRAYY